MTITIIKSHCDGGATCGHCRQLFGDQRFPDVAHDKFADVGIEDKELLLECPKLAIMEVDNGSSK